MIWLRLLSLTSPGMCVIHSAIVLPRGIDPDLELDHTTSRDKDALPHERQISKYDEDNSVPSNRAEGSLQLPPSLEVLMGSSEALISDSGGMSQSEQIRMLLQRAAGINESFPMQGPIWGGTEG